MRTPIKVSHLSWALHKNPNEHWSKNDIIDHPLSLWIFSSINLRCCITHFSHVYIKKSFYCHLHGKCMNIFSYIYPCKKKLYIIKSCSNERNLCSIWTTYYTLFYHCNTDIVNILYVELFFSFFSPWNYSYNYKILKFWFCKVWVFMKP